MKNETIKECMDNVHILIGSCLAYGIKIEPYKLRSIFRQYNEHRIPDEDLLHGIPSDKLQKYVDGLYLCDNDDDARIRRMGHDLLKEIGFKYVEREGEHGKFTSFEY